MNDEGEQVLTPSLIKAARALLRIDQAELAKRTGISRKTISLIEIAKQDPTDARRRKMLADLRQKMENVLGLEFIFESDATGEGVRLLKRLSE